ncbi:hypothetical protein AAMO2058_000462500 [Amorphochlora amoebiformis]
MASEQKLKSRIDEIDKSWKKLHVRGAELLDSGNPTPLAIFQLGEICVEYDKKLDKMQELIATAPGMRMEVNKVLDLERRWKALEAEFETKIALVNRIRISHRNGNSKVTTWTPYWNATRSAFMPT